MIADWIAQHRNLEALLEELAAAPDPLPLFPVVKRHLLHHYEAEDATMPAKIRRQHDDVREIIQAIEEGGDVTSMVRQLVALASHNIIEEERDWFPFLTPASDAAAGESQKQ